MFVTLLAFAGGFGVGYWVRAQKSVRRREAARQDRLRARERRKGFFPVLLPNSEAGDPDIGRK
jgi:hypothetical protein